MRSKLALMHCPRVSDDFALADQLLCWDLRNWLLRRECFVRCRILHVSVIYSERASHHLVFGDLVGIRTRPCFRTVQRLDYSGRRLGAREQPLLMDDAELGALARGFSVCHVVGVSLLLARAVGEAVGFEVGAELG